MEFDSQVASLQGAFLAHPFDMSQVLNIFCDGQKDQRKLFICLFLNTSTDTPDNFSIEEGMTFGPFLNLFQKTVNVSEFIEIVKKCNLQRFYAETISFFNVSTPFLESSLSVFTEGVDPYLKVALLAALVRNSRISQSDSERMLHFGKKILPQLNGLALGEKILSILYLMKTSMTNDAEGVLSKSLRLSPSDLTSFYCCDIQDLQFNSSIRKEFLQELITHFSILGRSMDVNSWIDLVDYQTEKILKKSFVNFWPYEEVPPCNLQLLIAHYSFEILEFSDHLNDNEAVAILRSFGKRFDRKMNLKLGDKSIQELADETKSILETGNPDMSWKVELYIQQIATAISVPDQEAHLWDLLASNAIYLKDFFLKFYQMANQMNIPARDNFLNTIGSILFHLDTESLENLLNDHLSSSQCLDQLKTSSFSRDLSVILKKANVSDVGLNSEFNRKLFWYAIQSPFHFFKQLIDECCQDKSMATLVLEILKSFPRLHQFEFVQSPFHNLWSKTAQPETVQNSLKLIDKLNIYWTESEMYDLMSSLSDLVLHNVLKIHLDSTNRLPLPQAQILSLLKLLERLMAPSVQKSSLDQRKVHILSLIELSGRYEVKFRTQIQARIKESLLKLLFIVAQTDPLLKTLIEDFACEIDKMRLTLDYNGKELCSIDNFLEIVLQSFNENRCIRVNTSNHVDAKRFLGELITGFSLFLPCDFEMIATNLKVQKHRHGKAILVPPYHELLKALVVFLAVQPSELDEHQSYVTNSVIAAVSMALEDLKEPDFDELSCLLQMAGHISSRSSIFENNIETLFAKIVQTGLGADNLSKSDLCFLIAPLSRMPQSEAKGFCLNKIRLMADTVL